MIQRISLLLVVLSLSACGYGTIQSMRGATDASQDEIESLMGKRAEIVPSLVQAAKARTAPDDTIFTAAATKVNEARTELMSALQKGENPGKLTVANSELTGALGRLVNLADNNDSLRADSSFLSVQRELAGTDARIARARAAHTKSAKAYNDYVSRFPASFTATVTGSGRLPYFAVTRETMRVPTNVEPVQILPPAPAARGRGRGGADSGKAAPARGADSGKAANSPAADSGRRGGGGGGTGLTATTKG